MFLEIHTDSRRKNAYSYGLFRETFRENGQVRVKRQLSPLLSDDYSSPRSA